MDSVHFMINGGQVIPEIDMPNSGTILELKEKIETVLNIIVARQTLSLNGFVLPNERIIDDLSLGPFATLVLDVQPLAGQPKFNIVVKSHAEEIFNIRVRETILVLDLKRKIERSRGVLAKNITLHRLSKEMDDHFPLSAYYVSEGCQLEMTVEIEPR